MVRITQNEYDLVLATLSAPLRKQLARESDMKDGVTFDDELAADVYTEMMSYIALHGMTRDGDLTDIGRELEAIALSIFKQSDG